MRSLPVNWQDRSAPEIQAVEALAATVYGRAGYFCITRMEPGPRDSSVSYWASVAIGPDVRFTVKADTLTEAALAASERLRSGVGLYDA